MRHEYGVINNTVDVELGEQGGEIIPVVSIGHVHDGNGSTNRMAMSWELLQELDNKVSMLLSERKYGTL